MSDKAFVDTNVLIYAACGAVDEPEKWARAWDIIQDGEYVVSGQVMAEFYVNSIKRDERKKFEPLELHEANKWIDDLAAVAVVPVDEIIVQHAVQYSQRFKISYWDAALIAAAEKFGSKTLYTEDLNHGQTYGSVTVINPFKANP
jgi:predicted nucleic acid-binding protein